MPQPQPQPGAKPGAKKPGHLGGLPWWAWVGAAAVGLAIGYFLLKPAGDAAAEDGGGGGGQRGGGSGSGGGGIGGMPDALKDALGLTPPNDEVVGSHGHHASTGGGGDGPSAPQEESGPASDTYYPEGPSLYTPPEFTEHPIGPDYFPDEPDAPPSSAPDPTADPVPDTLPIPGDPPRAI